MKITLASAPISLDRLARMAGGQLVLWGTDTPPAVSHICTDSREADNGTLFCAIRGERVDGHSYLATAARAGCVAFLCERLPDGVTVPEAPVGAAILVEDTVTALGRLAAARREGELTDLGVVAITGSVGKTTTKEMTAAVLGEARRVFKKDGNYNSTIGLPLSVLEIKTPDPDVPMAAVLEMGMSSRGEIAAMSAAVHPDMAVIVNIGSSHLEHLGTRENIARAKLEIASGLRSGGILLCNRDEPLLDYVGQDFSDDRPIIPSDIRILGVSLAGTPGADFTAVGVTPRDGGMDFDLITPTGRLRDLHIPAPGEHLVWAGAFAAAVGYLSGMDGASIRAGLASYRTAALRQSMRTVAGVTLIEDCYNAAPESMRAALAVLEQTAPSTGRRIAVLGDMRELGTDSEILHRAVGAETIRCGVDLLVTVGALGAHIAAGARAAGLAESAVLATDVDPAAYPALAGTLAGLLHPGDTVLFKASRALGLEALSSAVAAMLES